MIKFYVLWATRALDDNFSVVALDITSVYSSLIPGQFDHILHAERVEILEMISYKVIHILVVFIVSLIIVLVYNTEVNR